MRTPLFYKSTKAAFGLDIGQHSIKVAQLAARHGHFEVSGYGMAFFDPAAVEAGVIVRPEIVAECMKNLFERGLIGHVNSDRIIASVPIAHIYTRILNIPKLTEQDLVDAVRLQAEQYIPVNPDDLYLDYAVIGNSAPKTPQSDAPIQQTVLMVATPKKIINSYLALFSLLNLEVSYIEANMFANLRAVAVNCPDVGSRIVIDVGAASSDMAIFDRTVRLTNTVAIGGANITNNIASALKVTPDQANQLKIRYGIAKSRWQGQLATALEPILSSFANEVQKMTRYQHDHGPTDQPVKQIILLGGGANMPGLADFLTHLTGIETLICNPWQRLVMAGLQPPAGAETTIYATAVGLALKQFDRHD